MTAPDIIFSKAASSNPPKEYLDEAKSNNLLFAKYTRLRRDINKFDKQLFYSQNPEIFLKDSTDYVADSLKILTEYLEKKEMQDIWKGVDTLFSNNQILKILRLLKILFLLVIV